MGEWKTYDTKHVRIHYRDDDDIKKLYKRIDFGPKTVSWKSFFSKEDPDYYTGVAKKLDALVSKVRSILGMVGNEVERYNLRLYNSHESLWEEFKNIYGVERQYLSWYRSSNRSIYANTKELDEGILAHEMAHGIVNDWFGKKPPRHTAEILARYVDTNLGASIRSH